VRDRRAGLRTCWPGRRCSPWPATPAAGNPNGSGCACSPAPAASPAAADGSGCGSPHDGLDRGDHRRVRPAAGPPIRLISREPPLRQERSNAGAVEPAHPARQPAARHGLHPKSAPASTSRTAQASTSGHAKDRG
jgi:hypothetical protein